MSEGSRSRGRASNGSDRRPLRFWEPFNIWWRAELEKTGKRASSEDIGRWYTAQSGYAWGPEKPSLQETRTHAKCLRSVSSVRDYFREYRAKKKHEQNEMDMDEEYEEEERKSRSRASKKASGSRSKAARSNSTAAYSDVSGVMQPYMGYSNDHGYWGSGYCDGAASGVTTAAAGGAAAAACSDHQDTAGYGYGQQMPGYGTVCVHPGAFDASWAGYQAAVAANMGTPGASQGLAGPSTQDTQQAALQQSLEHSGQKQKQEQQPGAGSSAAAAAPWQHSSASTLPSSSQQQQMQQPGHQDQLCGHVGRPPAAEHLSMNGLLSPGLHQLAGAMAFHVEMPAISPRLQQPHLVMSDTAAGLGMDLQQTTYTTAAFNQPTHSGSPAVKAEPGAPQESLQQAARMPVPLWGTSGQHNPSSQQASQADVHAAAVAGAGAIAAHQAAMQQWQQQVSTEQYAQPCFLQHHASTAEQQGAGRSGGRPAADASASGPRPATQQQQQPQSHAALGCNTGGAMFPATSTHQGGLPSSLLAAMAPLPGCPGHNSVDSILRQIEAGAQTPRGFAAAAGGASGNRGIDGQMFPRISLSTLLDAPSMLHSGRRPSQSFEHLPLPQQRLSLCAMGSDMLDMLADGLDLDTFLGPSDLAAGPAGVLHGTGADTIAPVAPGSRVSIRWLRASCSMQVPEHWQQHIHTLQDAPFGRGPGQASTAADRATESYLRMGRASSSGIDALAEAAAAALAAHPEVLEECNRAAAAAAGTAAATQPAATATDAPGEQGQSAGGQVTRDSKASGCNKRGRQEQNHARGAGGAAGPAVPEGGLGPGRHEFKRPCTGAGLGVCVAADSTQPQGHKVVLDLATPRPQATLQPPPVSLPPQAPTEPQQSLLDLQAPQPLLQPVATEQEEQADGVAQEQCCKHTALGQVVEVAAGTLEPQQDANAAQKRSVVLDLRPEELGATSENTLVSPQHATAQQGVSAQQGLGPLPASAAPHATTAGQGGKRVAELMLQPLVSPAGGSAAAPGMNTRGGLQCGPATAASTTGAPPRGPDGAPLPAPAMARMAMAAAVPAAPGVPKPAGAQGMIMGQGPSHTSDPAKRFLPAMHEIERMI